MDRDEQARRTTVLPPPHTCAKGRLPSQPCFTSMATRATKAATTTMGDISNMSKALIALTTLGMGLWCFLHGCPGAHVRTHTGQCAGICYDGLEMVVWTVS